MIVSIRNRQSEIYNSREEVQMPKMKTHRGAAKRFKVTGSGKIMCSKANRGHLLTGKSPKKMRTLRKSVPVPDVLLPNIRKMLPYQI